MSRSEYLDRLMQIGMGWLGWSEQQTLDTTIPALELAFEGRIEMLRQCFGAGDDTPSAPVKGVPLSDPAAASIFRRQAG